MIQEYEKDIAQRALEKAMKYGCDGCRVTLKKGTENELEVVLAGGQLRFLKKRLAEAEGARP